MAIVGAMLASERAYVQLRQDIISGHLPPGTALGEVDQAGRLGVSRTPLREALRRLGAEGLCVVGKGRTYTVSAISPEDVRHLFELREALETQAARLAALRGEPAVFTALADRFAEAAELLIPQDPEHAGYYRLVADLDGALDAAMHSPAIQRALVSLRSQVARARRLSRDDHQRLVQAAQEHRIIAEAIAAGDGTLAAQATAIHLRASLASILIALDKEAPAATSA
ncbi:GntR family transcriptional regulator [Pseudactinotalea sp. Z1739]